MRDAVTELGSDPKKIKGICPIALVIDHSVQADYTRSSEAVLKYQDIEFERNKDSSF